MRHGASAMCCSRSRGMSSAAARASLGGTGLGSAAHEANRGFELRGGAVRVLGSAALSILPLRRSSQLRGGSRDREPRPGQFRGAVAGMAGLPGDGVEDRFLNNGDVELHYVEAGPPDGPLILFLHGFPSFWYTWKNQIRPFSEKGFHVVAPDLRGYNLSSKPEGVAPYGRETLLSDVTAFLDQCGAKDTKAVLVGHDWGGFVAWNFAQEFPERISKLVIINSPFPSVFSSTLRSDVQQMRKSWYIFMFQLPALGEHFLKANDFKSLKAVIADDPVQPQSEEHTRFHVEAFSRPGALTATINYYRAIFWFWQTPEEVKKRKVLPLTPDLGKLHWYWHWQTMALVEVKKGKVEVPVLMLWGEKDLALVPSMADAPRDVVPNFKLIRFPDASHWLMWDEPEKVNQHILRFIEQGTSEGAKFPPQVQSKL